MAVVDNLDGMCLHEEISPKEVRIRDAGNAGEILTRMELDVAYSSEKVLNLDILLMHVASRASDYEALAMENKAISTDGIEKALEFDMLSGILDSEVKELDGFVTTLQTEIVDAQQRIHPSEDFRMSEIEEKLHDAEESLKQSHDQVAEIRMQSAKFKRIFAFGGQEAWIGLGEELPENGYYNTKNDKWKLQTVEQQRHILQMLEKSLARELDLEKKLSESRHNEGDITLKLHFAESEAYCMEESMEAILERLFEAENAAEALMGISKELMSKLQIVQFNLNGSIHRERDMRSKLEQSMLKLSAEESALHKLKATSAELDNFLVQQVNGLKASLKETEEKCILANSEALTLREKVNSLEEQLGDSDIQLHEVKVSFEASQEQENVLHSEIRDMEDVAEDLKGKIVKAEFRAESAESRCKLLTDINLELNEELGSLRNNGERADSLEKKLKESDAQLEYAKSSVEANEEQQNLLYSTLSDMENLIEDLKSKVSKAESRAKNAESKCTLLTETNLELNEELGFLRNRLECLETSLHQADEAKIAAAMDISIRTKMITDLVMKLALERERLQIQISALAKEDKILAEKCWKIKDNVPIATNQEGTENGKEFAFIESFEVEDSAAAMPVCKADMEPTVPVEDDSVAASKPETVRTIEAGQLNSKHVAMAILILVISVVAVYLFQLESCPF